MIGTRNQFAGIGRALQTATKPTVSGIGIAAQSLSSADRRKAAAWAKARVTLGALITGGNNCRMDDFGNIIRWEDYGDHTSQYGWEIDHTQPSALGGTDHHSNLRALHYKTNRSLGGLLGDALNSR